MKSKVAILIVGETRTWDSQHAKPPDVSMERVDVSGNWKMFKQNNPEIDIYGVTWDYCKQPKDDSIFKKIYTLDFNGKEFRNEALEHIASSDALESDPRKIGFLYNSVAQHFQWLYGIDKIFKSDDYQLVLKVRWDIYPTSPEKKLDLLSTLTTPTPTLFVSKLMDNEYKIPCWIDMIFIVNRILWEKGIKDIDMGKRIAERFTYPYIESDKSGRFYFKTTSETAWLQEDILGCNLSLKPTSIIKKHFQRTVERGYENWLGHNDNNKNQPGYGKRPPT